MTGQFLARTPEQIADALEQWFDPGVDGFNVVYAVILGTFEDFIDAVVPEFRHQGLVQAEYVPGTLREKPFDRPHLPKGHPAAVYRRQ